MTVLGNAPYRLIHTNSGKLRTSGVDEPEMEVVARSGATLICKIPGYSFNMSGIRGMRDDRYVASEMRAFEIIDDTPNGLTVRELVCWPTRPKPTTVEVT